MNMIIKRTEKQKPQKKYKHWYLRGFFAMQLQCRVRGAVSHMFNRCVSYSRRRDPGFPSKAPTTNEIPHSAARGALGPAPNQAGMSKKSGASNTSRTPANRVKRDCLISMNTYLNTTLKTSMAIRN